MAKKLHISDNLSDGYLLYSIVSPLADYRISYFINSYAALDLKKYGDMSLNKDPNPVSVSWFYFLDENINTSYYLIGNKGKEGLLFSELKQIDYLLLIKSSFKENDFEEKIKQIRNIQQVFAVLKQDFQRLFSADEFLEANEMHEFVQVIQHQKHIHY